MTEARGRLAQLRATCRSRGTNRRLGRDATARRDDGTPGSPLTVSRNVLFRCVMCERSLGPAEHDGTRPRKPLLPLFAFLFLFVHRERCLFRSCPSSLRRYRRDDSGAVRPVSQFFTFNKLRRRDAGSTHEFCYFVVLSQKGVSAIYVF